MARRRSLLAVAVVALTPTMAAPATAQQPPIVADYMQDAAQAGGKLVSLAQAMPDSTWDWRPMEGVRSVAEVFRHVIGDNYLLAAMAGHPAPASTGITTDYNTAVAYEHRSDMSKDETVAALQASLDHLRDALAATSADQLDQVVTLFGSQTTVRGLWLMTITHLHEHLGQSIAYARSNRVTPPWSR